HKLYAEEVSLEAIAKQVGTPFYVYSFETIKRHFQIFDNSFEATPHLVCYSVKANSNLSILKLLADLGAGMDIVSKGELFRALKVSVNPKKIVFSGVGKTKEEIKYALESEILMLNVESLEELDKINAVARELHIKAPVSLRINPDIDAKTHPHITTGLDENKFGISFKEAVHVYLYARKLLHLNIIGVDCHIGSQLTELEPVIDAVKKIRELVTELQKYDLPIQYIDLGGGLGIHYSDEEPPHPSDYGKAIAEVMKGLDVTLVFEPGRVIMGNAGLLVTELLYRKKTPKKYFYIVDAAMNDLIRPSLYDAYQNIVPVYESGENIELVDVVGPICESGDFLGKDRKLPSAKRGDLFAVMSSGAYGFSMSSNYNTRPRVAEVLVKGSEFYVIREREKLEDLIRGECIINL
ncbi:MAG: diaminopimelate decarboxylase, partial [Deltaproteobacteria bacterium]|nr:diaminopimelate decarboxylase [Deltaproteobacteria bacterium]